MNFHQELVETWGMMKLRCATMECNLPETDMAPENNPLEKEIPIGNHHFLGAKMFVLGTVAVGVFVQLLRITDDFGAVGFNTFFPQIHCSIGPRYCKYCYPAFHTVSV